MFFNVIKSCSCYYYCIINYSKTWWYKIAILIYPKILCVRTQQGIIVSAPKGPGPQLKNKYQMPEGDGRATSEWEARIYRNILLCVRQLNLDDSEV